MPNAMLRTKSNVLPNTPAKMLYVVVTGELPIFWAL